MSVKNKEDNSETKCIEIPAPLLIYKNTAVYFLAVFFIY